MGKKNRNVIDAKLADVRENWLKQKKLTVSKFTLELKKSTLPFVDYNVTVRWFKYGKMPEGEKMGAILKVFPDFPYERPV